MKNEEQPSPDLNKFLDYYYQDFIDFPKNELVKVCEEAVMLWNKVTGNRLNPSLNVKKWMEIRKI
jgi:hypothetical protein